VRSVGLNFVCDLNSHQVPIWSTGEGVSCLRVGSVQALSTSPGWADVLSTHRVRLAASTPLGMASRGECWEPLNFVCTQPGNIPWTGVCGILGSIPKVTPVPTH
jgi:hypothetical protein